MQSSKPNYKKRVLAVFGTRPEAIKLAPLIKRLSLSQKLELYVAVSGQHRQMLDGVLEEFGIIPNFDLAIMRENQTLAEITASVLEKLPALIAQVKPDAVLVHGDTATAFAASLAAFYQRIDVVHIEAGLRSGDIFSPYPEEFYRKSISSCAKWHFAPTERAGDNLIAEGVRRENIFIVGNTGIDALAATAERGGAELYLRESRPFALLTLHRREHSESEIESIFYALTRLAEVNPQIDIVYPVHKNPRIAALAERILKKEKNIILTEPLPTALFHSLLRRALFVMSDSGGIQEEAVFLGKPTLVLRDTTERPEGVALGVLRLVGSNADAIYQAADELIHDAELYARMSMPSNIYGDGHASERISAILEKLL